MDYLIIGYGEKGKNIAYNLSDKKELEDNIYVYATEPILEFPKGVQFIKHDTFRNKSPDVVFIDMPFGYDAAWYNVAITWTKDVFILED